MNNNQKDKNDSLVGVETDAMAAHLLKLEGEALDAEREAVRAAQAAQEKRAKIEKAKQVLIELGFPLPHIERANIPSPTASTRKGGRRKAGVPTWTGEILKIVQREGLISYPELRDILSVGPLAKKMQISDKGFYGGLNKLSTAKKIIRHHDHAFSIEEFGKYKNEVIKGLRDEIISKSRGRSGGGIVVEKIISFLDANPGGAKANDIISLLKLNNPNSGYNALKRLVVSGDIHKDEDTKVYWLAKYQKPIIEPKTAALQAPLPR